MRKQPDADLHRRPAQGAARRARGAAAGPAGDRARGHELRPDEADYVIPGNDDAIRSCSLIVRAIADAIEAGKQKVTVEELRANGPRQQRCRVPARRRAARGRGRRGRRRGAAAAPARVPSTAEPAGGRRGRGRAQRRGGRRGRPPTEVAAAGADARPSGREAASAASGGASSVSARSRPASSRSSATRPARG